jgi:hypothetical protein
VRADRLHRPRRGCQSCFREQGTGLLRALRSRAGPLLVVCYWGEMDEFRLECTSLSAFSSLYFHSLILPSALIIFLTFLHLRYYYFCLRHLSSLPARDYLRSVFSNRSASGLKTYIQLSFTFSKTLDICTIDDINDAIYFGEVVLPQSSRLLMTAQIICSELDVPDGQIFRCFVRVEYWGRG